MPNESQRLPEKIKNAYSADEITHLYALGRFFIENGNLVGAEWIFKGISEIAPQSALGWLGLTYLALFNQEYDKALEIARKAVKTNEHLVNCLVAEATTLLSLEDIATAGTVLGELGERAEQGELQEPNLLRFYRAQLVRYQG